MSEHQKVSRFAKHRHRVGSQRRGISLLEMVAVMGLLSTTAVLAYRSISHLTEVTLHSSNSRLERITVDRFARTFRADVAQSQSVTADHWPIQVVGPDTMIEYSLQSSPLQIQRTVTQDSQQIASDRFPIFNGAQWTVTVQEPVTQVFVRHEDQLTWCIEATMKEAIQ